VQRTRGISFAEYGGADIGEVASSPKNSERGRTRGISFAGDDVEERARGTSFGAEQPTKPSARLPPIEQPSQKPKLAPLITASVSAIDSEAIDSEGGEEAIEAPTELPDVQNRGRNSLLLLEKAAAETSAAALNGGLPPTATNAAQSPSKLT
jgi:hypothetical protein